MEDRPLTPGAVAAPIHDLDTLAVHGAGGPDPVTGAVVTPVVQSTTFAQEAIGRDRGFTYSRAANPTVAALERALAALEGLPHALAFGSGMGAVTTLALATLGPGDRLVCSEVVYGGIERLAREVLAPLGIDPVFVDTADLDAVTKAVTPATRLVFVETPANPTLALTDIAAVAEIAHARGALYCVDNTFLTAALQRPAELGADVVLSSTTKFVEGHNSAIGGAIVLGDGALFSRLDRRRKTLGTIQAPWNAWITLRGLKTLPLRMERHSANALAVARALEGRPGVERVGYPWLESAPGHELARRQQRSGGGVLWFEVAGGLAAARRVTEGLALCTLAESLGAVETLATHPASMTHADVPRARREHVGIGDGLIRLSVGLESPAALLADLANALDAATEEGAS